MGLGGLATLVAALAVLAAAFWMRDGERDTRSGLDRDERVGAEAAHADQARAAEPAPARPRSPASPARPAPATTVEPAVAGFAAPFETPPGRSPLERSPGYVPPADPESASVRLGRRDAPLLDGEFDGGAASLQELGRLVVAALNAGDESGLHALRVTRSEFERFLWREFPQSRPITNVTADDAWSLSDAGSVAGASRAVGLRAASACSAR